MAAHWLGLQYSGTFLTWPLGGSIVQLLLLTQAPRAEGTLPSTWPATKCSCYGMTSLITGPRAAAMSCFPSSLYCNHRSAMPSSVGAGEPLSQRPSQHLVCWALGIFCILLWFSCWISLIPTFSFMSLERRDAFLVLLDSSPSLLANNSLPPLGH